MKELKAEVAFVPGDTAYMIYERKVVKGTIRNVTVRFYNIGDDILSSCEFSVDAKTDDGDRYFSNVDEKRVFNTREAAQEYLDDYLIACEKIKEFEKHMELE